MKRKGKMDGRELDFALCWNTATYVEEVAEAFEISVGSVRLLATKLRARGYFLKAFKRGPRPGGAPRATSRHQYARTKKGNVKNRGNWTPEIDAMLGTHTCREVAKLVGVTHQAVAQRRAKLGIDPPPDVIDVVQADPRLGTMSDVDLAELIGCAASTVTHARARQGIPTFARPIDHGRNGYSLGCSCEVCKQGTCDHMKALREANLEAWKASVAVVRKRYVDRGPHDLNTASISTYIAGCRCAACSFMGPLYNRDRAQYQKLRASRLIGYLTKREVARRLGVHPQTVQRFLMPRAGVSYVRIGYRNFIREEDIPMLGSAILKPRCVEDRRSEDARAQATRAAVQSTVTVPAAEPTPTSRRRAEAR